MFSLSRLASPLTSAARRTTQNQAQSFASAVRIATAASSPPPPPPRIIIPPQSQPQQQQLQLTPTAISTTRSNLHFRLLSERFCDAVWQVPADECLAAFSASSSSSSSSSSVLRLLSLTVTECSSEVSTSTTNAVRSMLEQLCVRVAPSFQLAEENQTSASTCSDQQQTQHEAFIISTLRWIKQVGDVISASSSTSSASSSSPSALVPDSFVTIMALYLRRYRASSSTSTLVSWMSLTHVEALGHIWQAMERSAAYSSSRDAVDLLAVEAAQLIKKALKQRVNQERVVGALSASLIAPAVRHLCASAAAACVTEEQNQDQNSNNRRQKLAELRFNIHKFVSCLKVASSEADVWSVLRAAQALLATSPETASHALQALGPCTELWATPPSPELVGQVFRMTSACLVEAAAHNRPDDQFGVRLYIGIRSGCKILHVAKEYSALASLYDHNDNNHHENNHTNNNRNADSSSSSSASLLTSWHVADALLQVGRPVDASRALDIFFQATRHLFLEHLPWAIQSVVFATAHELGRRQHDEATVVDDDNQQRHQHKNQTNVAAGRGGEDNFDGQGGDDDDVVLDLLEASCRWDLPRLRPANVLRSVLRGAEESLSSSSSDFDQNNNNNDSNNYNENNNNDGENNDINSTSTKTSSLNIKKLMRWAAATPGVMAVPAAQIAAIRLAIAQDCLPDVLASICAKCVSSYHTDQLQKQLFARVLRALVASGRTRELCKIIGGALTRQQRLVVVPRSLLLQLQQQIQQRQVERRERHADVDEEEAEQLGLIQTWLREYRLYQRQENINSNNTNNYNDNENDNNEGNNNISGSSSSSSSVLLRNNSWTCQTCRWINVEQFNKNNVKRENQNNSSNSNNSSDSANEACMRCSTLRLPAWVCNSCGCFVTAKSQHQHNQQQGTQTQTQTMAEISSCCNVCSAPRPPRTQLFRLAPWKCSSCHQHNSAQHPHFCTRCGRGNTALPPLAPFECDECHFVNDRGTLRPWCAQCGQLESKLRETFLRREEEEREKFLARGGGNFYDIFLMSEGGDDNNINNNNINNNDNNNGNDHEGKNLSNSSYNSPTTNRIAHLWSCDSCSSLVPWVLERCSGCRSHRPADAATVAWKPWRCNNQNKSEKDNHNNNNNNNNNDSGEASLRLCGVLNPPWLSTCRQCRRRAKSIVSCNHTSFPNFDNF